MLKEAGSVGNIQIPHTPLEVDDMGLYNLKARASDIANINPKPKVEREFCEPILRHTYSNRESSEFKQANYQL